ncbi:protein brown [Episyrphus balteatus]|uniref:protein brown n=1 Tax=Episyrphus balteatus TaxID=286459 RepID=UPI0024867A82|nr:protein brown [Episyrphus balteatus]
METNTDLCLEWKNINFSVPANEGNNFKFWHSCQQQKEINILHNVSGSMKTGDLVAILGGSGAGKTTLLAAISQRLRGSLTGDIVLNGVAIDRKEMTRLSSFLPQFEISVRTFTAFEHLYFMSHFKMHRKTTKAQKLQRVNDLLRTVGLSGSANVRIQNLSGGERKRLSLAEELITNPPFLFCDEPTTGLDSFSALSVVKTLRQLCKRPRQGSSSSTRSSSSNSNPQEDLSSSIEMEVVYPSYDNATEDLLGESYQKSVICSIHQPTSDIYELFTHVILMDDGRIIYQGTTDDALKFFKKIGFNFPQNCNPADFYLKAISDSHSSNNGAAVKLRFDSEVDGLYEGSWLLQKTCSKQYLHRINNFKKISWFYQVYLLLLRYGTEEKRNMKGVITSLAFYMITSVTLSVMYSGVIGLNQLSVQDITGSIFIFTTEVIFTASYGVMFYFPSSLPIIRREVGEGTYSLSAFYTATIFAMIPAAFYKSYLFFGLIYLSVQYTRGWTTFLMMGFVLSLASIAGTAYGIFISSLFEKDKLSSEMAAPFDLLFLIFGGAYYNVDSLPVFKYLSVFFYSNEALMYDYWIDVDGIECPKNMNHPCVRTGIEVLKQNSFRTEDFTILFDCSAILVLAGVFHLMAFCLIRKYVNRTGYY